jgi:phage shock protein E
MNWPIVIIVGSVLLVFFVWKRLSVAPVEVARKHLAAGALVIDVRSPEEFGAGHVANAMNIPLGELRESLPRRVKDKEHVLLLHCLSGVRSAIAKRQARNLGYKHVFNLGSLVRAQRIVEGARAE